MSDSELIKKYIAEIDNKVDILMKEMSSLHEKIDKLYKDESTEKDEEHYITEKELILNIDKGIFDHKLEGKKVILSEDTRDHEWIIVRVNSNSYDLWYNGSIGKTQWSENLDMSWDNSNVRQLCNNYKSKLSPIVQAKLKSGLNVNCGDDLVVILSVNQLGCTSHNIINDDNIIIPYFNDNDKRSINMDYWTTSFSSNKVTNLMNNIWCIDSIGIPYEYYYAYNYNSHDVVPAIRLG